MARMRRASAAQSRRGVIRSQGLFYGLDLDSDPRSVGDPGASGIRFSQQMTNFSPQGNKIVSRRAMVKTAGALAADSQDYNTLLSQIESWDGSILTAYKSAKVSTNSYYVAIYKQTTSTATPTLLATFTLADMPNDLTAKFYRISATRIMLAVDFTPIIGVARASLNYVVIYKTPAGAYATARLNNYYSNNCTYTLAASTLPSTTLGSYKYNFAYSLCVQDSAGTVIHQTPLQAIFGAYGAYFSVAYDEKMGTSGYTFYTTFTNPSTYFPDYTHIQIWRTKNYSTDTGNADDNALAGSPDLYYKLKTVAIADLPTTNLWDTLDTELTGREVKIYGFDAIPPSSICAISPGYFVSASGQTLYYTPIGSTFTELGSYYTASQYYEFEDTVTAMALSNAWVLIATKRKTYRWDLITSYDAGQFDATTSTGDSIAVLGTPLQASGDIGIPSAKADSLVVATNGYLIAMCGDGSVRMFDGATWSDDYTYGRVRTLTTSIDFTTSVRGAWLPSGEYILWVGTSITLSLTLPTASYPHRWAKYEKLSTDSDTAADWQFPAVDVVYLSNGNSYLLEAGVIGQEALLIARQGATAPDFALTYAWNNTYPYPATNAEQVFSLGELTGDDWSYFIVPEEVHLFWNNLEVEVPTVSASLYSRDYGATALDTTVEITDGGQITVYPPIDANTYWHSFSVVFTITGGDIVINKVACQADVMDKNAFPTKSTYLPSTGVQTFRDPVVHLLTGLGTLMTAFKPPTDTTYGLLQGQGGASVLTYSTFGGATTSYAVVSDSPVGSFKSLEVLNDPTVSGESLLAYKTTNPRATAITPTISKGLFLQTGTSVASSTLVFGGSVGSNSVYSSSYMVGWWQKRLAGATLDTTDSTLVSIGTGFKVQLQATDATTNKITIANSTGLYGATLTDAYGSAFENVWVYYVLTCERTVVTATTWDETFTLYRGIGTTLSFVDAVTNSGVSNTSGVFYFNSESATILGRESHRLFDFSIYNGTVDKTTLWGVKNTATNSAWVYNAGESASTDDGN